MKTSNLLLFKNIISADDDGSFMVIRPNGTIWGRYFIKNPIRFFEKEENEEVEQIYFNKLETKNED